MCYKDSQLILDRSSAQNKAETAVPAWKSWTDKAEDLPLLGFCFFLSLSYLFWNSSPFSKLYCS